MSAAIDRVSFFDRLADEMNHHPEQYEALGELDLDLAVVMRDPHGDFAVRLTFGGTRCDGVGEIGDGDETTADCWLDGPKEAWQAMFDNIVQHGHATGRQTINSLTLLADQISVQGDDPLGVDKFFRFNQTVQAFFDGAANVASSAGT
jgi:hypothetical protein